MDYNNKIDNPLFKGNYHVYSAEEASELFNGRDIYIWGAGLSGRGAYLALERNGFKIKAFMDSSPLLIGREYRGIPILDPKSVLNDPNILRNSFILVAMSFNKVSAEVFAICSSAGLIKGKDFMNVRELSPVYPTVEVAGLCNLKCISCPRGNSENPPKKGGFMKASDYSKVAAKLIKEIPFLYAIDLYIWGEPLLNPELPDIIKINKDLGIGSGISSNLNAGKNLEEVIKASPKLIRVAVSGYGDKSYEVTHAGGKWDTLYKNLFLVAEYIKKYNANTIVDVYFHVNKNNIPDYEKIRELCATLGFKLSYAISTLFPDYAMDYVEGRKLCKEAQIAKDIMIVSLEEMIENARKEQHKTCFLKSAIPVINWDMSVQPCCNYGYHKLADSYLDISLAEIISARNNHPLCIKCQKHSLHRYFHLGYYSDYVKKVLNLENHG